LDFTQAIILGIVQGLGEFLPISSSAHLVLVPWLMGWKDAGLRFDVALHVGTLFAVIAYFWRDWIKLIIDGLSFKSTIEGKLFWFLVISTIPGGIGGYLLESYAATVFRNPLLIGIMLMILGVMLYYADTRSYSGKNMSMIGLRESLFIGVSQVLAIIPGVSRSGITMTAGRMMGLNRETSARFSFLLSTPIIAGAGLKTAIELSPGDVNVFFIAGLVVSAIVGFASIKFLLQYLTRRSFSIFIWYRMLAGLFVIGVYVLRLR